MSRLFEVEEILGIPAPVFIIRSITERSFSSCSRLNPFSDERLFDRFWQLNKIDFFRSEYSKNKWPFLFFFAFNFSVGNNDIVNWLFVMNGLQPTSYSDFPLTEPLDAACGFDNNIIFVDFPKSLLI